MIIANLETVRKESISANYEQFFDYCLNKEIHYDGENQSFEHIKYTAELLEGNVEYSNKQHEILVTKERINRRLRIHERECFVVTYNP